jgi:hypothetical protein
MIKSFKRFVAEGYMLDIDIGDTIMVGRFKNKKIVVKSIEVDGKGDLLINGKKVAKFRLLPAATEVEEPVPEEE